MKLLHLADLHFGKSLYSRSLIEDQIHWVGQIIDYVRENRPDAVVIAGDVYDRGIPVKEAVPVLTRLLTGIADEDIPVMLIAGNHDGGERLEFADALLASRNVYIAGTVKKEMVHCTLDCGDGFGPVTFWLMPYTFPAAIREVLDIDEETPLGYTEAVKALIAAQDIDYTARNVLIAHQTVSFGKEDPEIGHSCSAVGGVGSIDASAFDGFDYVALGHIHGHQKIGRNAVRYAGSPLCYHFDEAKQAKGPLMVTLGEKGGEVRCELQKLKPLHRVRPKMTGTKDEIIAMELACTDRDEYVEIELTDQLVSSDTHDMLTSLFRSHGSELLHISRCPSRTYAARENEAHPSESIPLDEYFLKFYREQRNDIDPSDKDVELIRCAADLAGSCHDESDQTAAAKLTDFILEQERDAR